MSYRSFDSTNHLVGNRSQASFCMNSTMHSFRRVFFRLPLELRREIYSYTLIAEKPVYLHHGPLSQHYFGWQEDSSTSNEELKCVVTFLWDTTEANMNDARAYFYSHNSFVIEWDPLAVDVLRACGPRPYRPNFPSFESLC